MRWFFCCLVIATCISTGASADVPALKQQLVAYLTKHPMDYPDELKARHAEASLTVFLSIDRNGKLLDETVSRGSGSKTIDQESLDWLKRLQPYPKIPEDVPVPFGFSFEIRFVPGVSLPNEDRVKRAMENVCRGC
jgi:TonB family protein